MSGEAEDTNLIAKNASRQGHLTSLEDAQGKGKVVCSEEGVPQVRCHQREGPICCDCQI